MSKNNSRCDCGSGKKYRNCCKNKMPRTIGFDFHPKNTIDLEGIAFSDKQELLRIVNGKILPFDGDVKLRYGYKRDNGTFKVLTEGVLQSGKSFLNPDLPLLQYKHIFSIDTNTKKIGNDRVSIAAVVYSQCVEKNNERVVMSQPILLSCYEYRNIEGNEENLAWMEMTEALGSAEQFSEGGVGLIVDSDLDNHSKYNNSEIPIYGNYCLPSRIKLIYGSSDGGMEVLANRMMRFSDKRSKYIIDALCQGYDAGDDGEVVGKPYSHFRQWYPDYDHPNNKLALTNKEKKDNVLIKIF